MIEKKSDRDKDKIYYWECTCSKNPINFKVARNNNFSSDRFSIQRYPCKILEEFKYINENQNNVENMINHLCLEIQE